MVASRAAFHPSLPRGFAKSALRSARARYGLDCLVEIHHVVPRQFAGHATLRRHRYDVEAPYNLLLMPSAAGAVCLDTIRPMHTGGHAAYDRHVFESLQRDPSEAGLLALLLTLHRGCRGRAAIPWR